MANIRFRKMADNADVYSVENISSLKNSPIEGMNICYLRSSVTYGAFSLQESLLSSFPIAIILLLLKKL